MLLRQLGIDLASNVGKHATVIAKYGKRFINFSINREQHSE